MSEAKKVYLTQQQIKDEQINFLLGDAEKNLEEYRRVLEIKEKQLSDAKKYLFLPNKAAIKQLLKIKN